MKNILNKKTVKAFGKDVFLLGEDKSGVQYWLEMPTWDCGWYWGFGYIKTYTNNKTPKRAADILSHTHFSGYVGQQREYDFDKKCEINKEYVYNVYVNKLFIKTTFSEKEGWEISELFKQFYLLQEMAEFTHKKKPSTNLCNSPIDHGDLSKWNETINKIMIPKITAKILLVLSPVNK